MPTATQYSISLDVTLDNVPGVLGRLCSAIGEAGGNIFAIEGFVLLLLLLEPGLAFALALELINAHEILVPKVVPPLIACCCAVIGSSRLKHDYWYRLCSLAFMQGTGTVTLLRRLPSSFSVVVV